MGLLEEEHRGRKCKSATLLDREEDESDDPSDGNEEWEEDRA